MSLTQQQQAATPVPSRNAQASSRITSRRQSYEPQQQAQQEAQQQAQQEQEQQYEDAQTEEEMYEEVEDETLETEDVQEEEEILIEPSDLIRAENEDWISWPHEDLSLHTSQMNLALLQLAEDIAQWRLHCSKINKNGKELYEQYVQQCHRLQRTSTILKATRRENVELADKLKVHEDSSLVAEQRYTAQQDRFKSNLEACQTMKDALTAANRRVKELEASKSEQGAAIEKQLMEREAALENAMELAQSLSKSLSDANERISQLEEEQESLTNSLESCESNFEAEREAMTATIESLQRENAEYSRQIDSLAETPSSSASGAYEDSDAHSHSATSNVPETPSKRSSSPQKRVEALSIRVETLRSHNAKLEDVINRQEKTMKMQLEEASHNEMKWKSVAKKVQQELEDVEVELDAQKLANEGLKLELSEADETIARSRDTTARLASAESQIHELTSAIAELEKKKTAAESRAEEMKLNASDVSTVQRKLDATLHELDSLRSAHVQTEDDMRLLYLQHKQEKADLEALYKHEDYKSRYADAINRASILHQKLTHVLQFIASNEAICKLASETTDRSAKEALQVGWTCDLTTPTKSVHSVAAVASPARGSRVAAAGATPRKATIASSSPYASPAVGSAKKSRSKVRRISMAISSSSSSSSLASSSSSSSLSSQQPSSANETAHLAQSLVDACKSWKSKCETLAQRIVGLETLIVRERQIRFDTVQKVTSEHEEQMQHNLDAIHISHDSQVARYEAELSAQSMTIEAQTEAYHSLHATYMQMIAEIEHLRMMLHNASCDLITYKTIYEETKAVTEEKYESEKAHLEDALLSVKSELDAQREAHEQAVAALREDIDAKDETIMFMESEAQSTRETEADARKSLLEEHYMQVSNLEVKLETQQVHMETQEMSISELKKNLESISADCAAVTQQRDDFASQLESHATSIVGLSLALQRSTSAYEASKTDSTDLNALLIQAEDERAALSDELHLAEIMLGRAKGTLMVQARRMDNTESQLVAQKEATFGALAHSEMLETEIKTINAANEERVSAFELALDQMREAHVNLQSEYETSKATLEAEMSHKVSELERLLSEQTSDSKSSVTALEEEIARAKSDMELQLSEKTEALAKKEADLEATLSALAELEDRSQEYSLELEALKTTLGEEEAKWTALTHTAESEKLGLAALLEASSRDAISLRADLEAKNTEVEIITRESERLAGEKEKVAVALERKTLELDLSLQSNTSLESSRNQLEVVIKRLENSQNEVQAQNVELEKTLDMERDELKKLCAQISSLQEQLAVQALQHQQALLKSSSSSILPTNSLSVSQHFAQQPIVGGASEEMERLYADHHLWLAQVKSALLTATSTYAGDVTSRRAEMEQESAAYRARITQLETLIQEREEERDTLNEKIARGAEDLTVAKNSHRTLILQNGMLSSLFQLALNAAAIAKAHENGAGSSVSNATTAVLANADAIAAIAEERGFVPSMKELMKLQRTTGSLLTKVQQCEDENKQLKIKLSESKTLLYEKEDTWIAQLRTCKQRYTKSEEQLKLAEQAKLQLFTFLAQIRESLVRTVQVPQIRDLLKQWTPLMNSLQGQLISHYPPTQE